MSSEFEKRFPKPEIEYKDESKGTKQALDILYESKREGWLEALKWVDDYIGITKVKTEIKELENDHNP